MKFIYLVMLFLIFSPSVAQDLIPTFSPSIAPAKKDLSEYIEDKDWLNKYISAREVLRNRPGKNDSLLEKKSRESIEAFTKLFNYKTNTVLMKILSAKWIAIGYENLISVDESESVTGKRDTNQFMRWTKCYDDSWESVKKSENLEPAFVDMKSELDGSENDFRKLEKVIEGGKFLNLALAADAKKNYKKAISYYEKASDLGDGMAPALIGNYFLNGIGVLKDEKKAYEYYLKSAKLGNEYGQNKLGLCYEFGKGAAQDYKEAMKWYLKSAEENNEDALDAIGVMYSNGNGVEKDYKEALKWFIKADENGSLDAARNIGALFDNGYGVNQDIDTALKWFKKAASKGDKEAADYIKQILDERKQASKANEVNGQEKDSYVSTSSVKLYSDYQANEVAADQKYKGRLLKVTGIVVSINKDIFGKPFVVLSNGEEYSSFGVDIHYTDNDIDWLSKLNKGQKITIKGICTGMVLTSPQIDVEE